MFTGIITDTASSCIIISNTRVYPSEYSIIVSATLLFLLSFRSILSVSDLWEEFMKNSLNMGIFPLLLSFGWIILYNVLDLA